MKHVKENRGEIPEKWPKLIITFIQDGKGAKYGFPKKGISSFTKDEAWGYFKLAKRVLIP